ncbi:hypothetical protein ABEB36_000132 [Hypothenemus hampei]|uniref:Uncharacterized protein n=1 Tax=Hypothenemus hampei TaxID=57062 RepID=A0ABD1FDY8_HYPHA
MDLTKKINSICQVKPIRSQQDLIIGEPKEIAYAKSVKGKYVQQILLDLDDCVIFLPQRVTDALTPHIDALKGHRIVVRGTRKFGNHETADFESLEPLKYSNCKWQYIDEIAYSSADKYDDNYYYDVHGDEDGVKCSRAVLEFLLMYNDVYNDDDDDDVRVIPFNCRNLLLASSDWESIFEYEYKYCVWINSYRIVSLNMTISKSQCWA